MIFACKKLRLLQAAKLLLIAAALGLASSAAAQSESYDQAGINNATLVTRSVPYTDSTGASLSVSLLSHTKPSLQKPAVRKCALICPLIRLLMRDFHLQGYFAYDSASDAKRGLVLIVPDW